MSNQDDKPVTKILEEADLWEEKERLQRDMARLKEQQKNFETERKNFTDAAIRLSREVKFTVFRTNATVVVSQLSQCRPISGTCIVPPSILKKSAAGVRRRTRAPQSHRHVDDFISAETRVGRRESSVSSATVSANHSAEQQATDSG